MSQLGLGLGLHKYRGGLEAPFVDSSLVLRLESDMGITLVGSDVDVWADQSGNGNNVSAPAAINRPSYGSNQLNGIDVLTFDGVDEFLDGPSFLDFGITNRFTIFAVYRTTSVSSDRSIVNFWQGSSNRRGISIADTPAGVVCAVSSDGLTAAASVTSASSVGNFHIGAWWIDGVNLNASIDNGTTVSFAFSSSIYNNAFDLVIGALGISRLIPYLGDITAIFIYNSSLPVVNRNQNFQYLSNKYGITLS